MRKIKGVVHLHSNWSYDGKWELKKLVKIFSIFNVNFLLMAEHDRNFTQQKLSEYRLACKEASTSKCIVIPGIEYSNYDNSMHILTWGNLPFFGEGVDTLTLVKNVESYSGVSVLAHPTENELYKKNYENILPYISGVEIWNRKSNGFCINDKAVELWSSKKNLVPLVTLDFHNKKQFFPLCIKINEAQNLSEPLIVHALKQGLTSSHAFGFPVKNFFGGNTYLVFKFFENIRKKFVKIFKKPMFK